MPTGSQLKDVALKAQVSETTVSRILSGIGDQYRISKATQDRVKQVAQLLEYRPNQLARSLRLHKTNTIGLIVPDISNPFFAGIANCIEREARAKGYFVILSVSKDEPELEKMAIQQLTLRNIDGIIISAVGSEKRHLEKLYHSKTPMVLIDRYFEGEPWSYVTSDNRLGGFMATEHLIKMGHTRIACVQGMSLTSPNNDRVAGYRQALEQYNIPFDNSLLVGDSFGKENGYRALKYLSRLDDNVKPTAIFSLSNLISLGILEAMAEQNLKVPDDFSLIAFDEQPYSAYLATPMTTIEQNVLDMGQQALDYLIGRIENKQEQPLVQISTAISLKLRDSVKNINSEFLKTIINKK